MVVGNPSHITVLFSGDEVFTWEESENELSSFFLQGDEAPQVAMAPGACLVAPGTCKNPSRVLSLPSFL